MSGNRIFISEGELFREGSSYKVGVWDSSVCIWGPDRVLFYIQYKNIYTVGLEMGFCEMGLCQFFLWFWYIHRVKMIWRSIEHEFLGRDSLYCNLLVNDSMCHSSNTLIWFDYWPSRPYTSHCAKTFFSCWKPARVCVWMWVRDERERERERVCIHLFLSFTFLIAPMCHDVASSAYYT